MRAVARAGALNCPRAPDRLTSLGEGEHIFPPRIFVEINGKKPTGLVFQERVRARHVMALQVVEDNLVTDRDEGLIRAVTTFASSLK
jgi:hypothetical protein